MVAKSKIDDSSRTNIQSLNKDLLISCVDTILLRLKFFSSSANVFDSDIK